MLNGLRNFAILSACSIPFGVKLTPGVRPANSRSVLLIACP